MWSSHDWAARAAGVASEGVGPAEVAEISRLIAAYHGHTGTQVDARLDTLRQLLAMAASLRPAYTPEQQRVLSITAGLPAERRAPVLQAKGIVLRPGVEELHQQVLRELGRVEGARDRWSRLRLLYTNGSRGPCPVPGPLLRVKGSYEREVYDPEHRPWGQESAVQQSWVETGSTVSLYEYADRREEPRQRVRYLTPSEAQGYRLTSRDGKLYRGEVPYSTARHGEGWDIFVMDGQGNFYVGDHEEMVFHHSSFLRGRPVKGAGQLKVKNGILARLSDRSGHYKPGREHMVTVVTALHSRHNVPLDGVVVEMYRHGVGGQLILGPTGFESEEHSALSLFLSGRSSTGSSSSSSSSTGSSSNTV